MTSLIAKTHYEILGLGRNADQAQIKAAYREKLLNTHPDKTNTIVQGDLIAQIKNAYSVLSKTDSRQKYDLEITENFKKNGTLSTGEGLDVFTLDDFECEEGKEMCTFKRDCPRCTSKDGFELNEIDLEENGTADGMGGYEIILQCSFCSLWLKVKYYDLQEEDI
jgi:diphthamide biosynthesis protein 4